MKKTLFLFLLIVFFESTYSQNLLKDSGFDDNFDCPSECTISNRGRLSNNLFNWKGSYGGAGYYHFCGDMLCPYQTTSGIPINAAGYQLPLSDSGYIALYALWDFTVTDYRGFAFQVLQQQIEVGRKYWVEYYTSLGDSADYAVSALGASFRTDTLNSNSPSASVFRRPFKMEHNGSPITNKESWQQLHWIYEADSAYQTFVIGYARGTNQIANDTLFVGSQCNWCEPLGNFSFYYVENAGIFPIISNNQTLQLCNFPQTLQGAVGSDIWFSQWGSDTTQANTLQIYGPGTYTQTWRTDTTVHIDTFIVEALLPQGNFFTNDTVPMAIGGSVVLNGPTGFAYLWSNNQISQSITVDTPGTYWLMITDESGCNRYDTVVVRYDSTVSTWQDWGEKEVEVFPNPAKNVFTINCKNTSNKINMQLYSADGKLINEVDFNQSHTFDTADLSNGIYFIKIVDFERKRLPLVKKIIVQK